jgi:hypothetical protein
MPDKTWSARHSLLSPYLNNGLLHASEVVRAALTRFAEGDIPLSSCEGFIRQIIGWREYINGMYWFLGEDYRELNGLEASRPLLPLFADSTRTDMNCVKTVVADVGSGERHREELARVHEEALKIPVGGCLVGVFVPVNGLHERLGDPVAGALAEVLALEHLTALGVTVKDGPSGATWARN